MLKAIRLTILLGILFFVAVSAWLSQSRSTDWNDSLWVKVYPINGDGSVVSGRYIDNLTVQTFTPIETFLEKQLAHYGRTLARPVRMELGPQIDQQPPVIAASRGIFDRIFWSLKMRLWARDVAGPSDDPAPDVRIFVRYHAPDDYAVLEDSVGMQKGMIGIVNAYSGRREAGFNNVVIAHEFLHTLGATDKYDPANGQPRYPLGYAEPDRMPRYPQRLAEIMGGRIPLSTHDAVTPDTLEKVVIGLQTAREIRLVE